MKAGLGWSSLFGLYRLHKTSGWEPFGLLSEMINIKAKWPFDVAAGENGLGSLKKVAKSFFARFFCQDQKGKKDVRTVGCDPNV